MYWPSRTIVIIKKKIEFIFYRLLINYNNLFEIIIVIKNNMVYTNEHNLIKSTINK